MCSVLCYLGTFFNFNLVVHILEDLQLYKAVIHLQVVWIWRQIQVKNPGTHWRKLEFGHKVQKTWRGREDEEQQSNTGENTWRQSDTGKEDERDSGTSHDLSTHLTNKRGEKKPVTPNWSLTQRDEWWDQKPHRWPQPEGGVYPKWSAQHFFLLRSAALSKRPPQSLHSFLQLSDQPTSASRLHSERKNTETAAMDGDRFGVKVTRNGFGYPACEQLHIFRFQLKVSGVREEHSLQGAV